MLRIGRNTFYDRKNEIPIKIPEFKRSVIGLIVEFRGIPNGFPNQAFKGGEGVVGLFEEVGDCISVHDGWELLSLLANEGSISLGKRCRTVAVEDCDDDHQGNRVGKGNLRVLCAFRNVSECIGSRDGNGGSGSFVGSKFELDFHCRREQGGPEIVEDQIHLGMKKSSIGVGGKHYLDYL